MAPLERVKSKDIFVKIVGDLFTEFALCASCVGYLLIVMKGITFVVLVEFPPTDEVLLRATTILH